MPEQNSKRIAQIQQNNSDEKYNLGTTFENVWLSENNSYNLKDLYDFLINYFNNDNSTFVMQSSSEPTNEKIKIWLDTSSQE